MTAAAVAPTARWICICPTVPAPRASHQARHRVTPDGTIGVMTPEQALLRVIHCLDRAHESGFKAKAFTRALYVVRTTPADELAERAAAGTRPPTSTASGRRRPR